MKRTFLFALVYLLAASAAGACQSLTVNGPVEAGRYEPLDGRARFARWWKEDGGSRSLHAAATMSVGMMMAENSPPQWGQAGEGLLRRTASSYASNLIQNSTHEGLAAALGSDTRYFACGCRGLFPRSGHALKMTFLTYTRNGRKTLDLPQLAGAYGGPMIVTLEWPRHYSPLVQGVQMGDFQIGSILVIHQVQEFAPELKRFFHVGGKNFSNESQRP